MRRPTVRIHHGDRFDDPYEWLRDKENPEVIGYLEAENDHTEAKTGRTPSSTDAVFGEIKARTKETDLSVPSYAAAPRRDAYWYYVRTVEGSEYPSTAGRRAPDRRTPPALAGRSRASRYCSTAISAAEGTSSSLGAFDLSRNGRLLAYSVD